MNRVRTLAAGTVVGALVAVPTAVLVGAPAHADIERRGACAGGSYEFSVDREGNGFEVNVDLDRVTPRSTWKVVVRHDGKRIAKVKRKADFEGDLDVERYRTNTAGADVFTFKAKRVGGGSGSCSATIRTA